MKLNKINISIGVALVGITYLIVNKVQKNNLSKDLYKKINSNEDVTGTGSDLGLSSYLQPTYYRKLIDQYGYGNIALANTADLDTRAINLGKELDKFNVDEERVLTLFKGLQSKSQVSFFSERFQVQNKKSLWDALKDIDNAYGFGWFQSKENLYLPKIKAYIDSLPIGILKNGKISK